MNEIRGYGLFNDVEEQDIRVYNRARTLKNIMQDFSDKEKNVNGKGAATTVAYMASIPQDERAMVYTKLEELLKIKDIE